MHIKLGMAQLLVEGGEPTRNFQRAIKLIEEAAEQNCDIVLLPEVIDFAWTHPSALEESVSVPGPYSNIFCEQAKKHGIFICVGLTDKQDDQNFNCAILINDQGEIISKYHKINLLEVEFPYYDTGKTLNVVDTKFGRIGLNICADNYIDGLPIGHTLARMGAQLILSPSSWTVEFSITEEDNPYEEKWIKPLSILSSLYDMVIVSTTSVGYIVGGPYEGKKKVGCSIAVGGKGIIAEGQFNEFAGELSIAEFDMPERKFKGTQYGKMLEEKGYEFDKMKGEAFKRPGSE